VTEKAGLCTSARKVGDEHVGLSPCGPCQGVETAVPAMGDLFRHGPRCRRSCGRSGVRGHERHGMAIDFVADERRRAAAQAGDCSANGHDPRRVVGGLRHEFRHRCAAIVEPSADRCR